MVGYWVHRRAAYVNGGLKDKGCFLYIISCVCVKRSAFVAFRVDFILFVFV